MMRRSRTRPVFVVGLGLAAIVALNGCSISGYSARFSPPVKQTSKVTLRENDFKYIERNLEGWYAYWRLFGIPLSDPRVFSNALADLYSSSQQQAEGKTTQLINWAVDESSFTLILVSRKAVKFRADLIEFTK